jgi:transcriptional regulator with GAF, ATPase, and Fis domain/tetratricopeptide (TPR) repeat protein
MILDSHGKPDDQLADLRARLLSQLAFSRLADSDTRAGLQFVTQAISCAKSPQLIGHLNILIAGLHWVACSYCEGTKASLRAIEILKPINAVYLLPMAYSHAGINLAAQGRYRSALEYHNGALIHARKTRSPYLKIQALANMTEAYCRSGQLGLALEISRDLTALAKTVANRSLAVSCHLCNAELLITGLRFREAYRKLSQIVSSRRHRIPEYVRVQALALSAWLHVELGNFIPARKYIEAIGVMGSSSKNLYEIELARIFEARILLSEGHVERAKELLDDVLSRARKARWEMHVLMARIWLAKCAMSLGQLDEARLIARRAMRLSIIMPAYRYQAEAHLLLGKIAIARTNGITASSPPVERLCTTRSEKTEDDYLHHLQEAIRLSMKEGFLDIEMQARTELARVGLLMQRLDYCMDNLARAEEAVNSLLTVVPKNLRARYAQAMGIVAARKILAEIRRKCEYEVSVRQCNVITLESIKLRGIERIARIIPRLHRTKDIFDVIVERLFDIEELGRIVFYLADGEDQQFKAAMERVRDEKWRCGDRGYEIDVVRNVFRSGQPFISANCAYDLRFQKVDNSGDKREMALLCMPLKAWGQVVGVLYSEGRAFDGGVSESTVHYMSSICNIAAMGLVGGRHYEDRVRQETILNRQVRLRNNAYNEIIGMSAAMCRVREHMEAVAMAPTDVLICGETGTGKELVARALHRTGKRAGAVFVAIDCGSLTDSLAESELFGYRKGAFTGATENRAGLFEAAQGGVVFLDEVSNLPMRLQSKLLRVLQEREVRRIGEVIPRKIDVQIIAATNKDLLAEIEKGKFRRDLYHRLNVMQIRMPPLRDRVEDIPILIDWFLGKLAQGEGGEVKTFSNEARQLLMEYPYPGNVRELAHIVESSYYLAQGRVIQVGDLPAEVRNLEIMENSTWSSESHALTILRRIDKGEGNFLDLVKIPFMRHRIGVDVVRRLLHRALTDAGGLYKSAFQRLGIPDREYATVKQFLKRNGCYLDFRPYRRRGSR